jgi:hypothetical protein
MLKWIREQLDVSSRLDRIKENISSISKTTVDAVISNSADNSKGIEWKVLNSMNILLKEKLQEAIQDHEKLT